MNRYTFTVFRVQDGYAIKAYRRFLFLSIPIGWESSEEPWEGLSIRASFDSKTPYVIYPSVGDALMKIEECLFPLFCQLPPMPVVTVGRDELV